MPTDYPRADFSRRETIRLLEIARHVHCPRANPGCRCRQCLDKPVRLNVQTFVDPNSSELVPPCTRTLTCDCGSCQAERAELVRIGPRNRKQPWELAA